MAACRLHHCHLWKNVVCVTPCRRFDFCAGAVALGAEDWIPYKSKASRREADAGMDVCHGLDLDCGEIDILDCQSSMTRSIRHSGCEVLQTDGFLRRPE